MAFARKAWYISVKHCPHESPVQHGFKINHSDQGGKHGRGDHHLREGELTIHPTGQVGLREKGSLCRRGGGSQRAHGDAQALRG
jgi:hypothetical protein